jgi:hypothetical protein
MARKVLMCLEDDCNCQQEYSLYQEGEKCPNCGYGTLVECILIQTSELEGMNGKHILALIRSADTEW